MTDLPTQDALRVTLAGATKGPWRAEYDENTGGTRIYDPSGYLVALFGNAWSIVHEPKKVAADAEIAALAPQLAAAYLRLSADLAAVVAANGLLVARDAESRDALEWVLPMAAGYASEHPVGRNAEIVAAARAFLASTEAGK